MSYFFGFFLDFKKKKINYILDNELEEEEELENITEQNDEIIEEKQGNQQTETEEPNIQNFEETENKKEGTQTKNKMLPSENKGYYCKNLIFNKNYA